jgi:hypothetical protein
MQQKGQLYSCLQMNQVSRIIWKLPESSVLFWRKTSFTHYKLQICPHKDHLLILPRSPLLFHPPFLNPQENRKGGWKNKLELTILQQLLTCWSKQCGQVSGRNAIFWIWLEHFQQQICQKLLFLSRLYSTTYSTVSAVTQWLCYQYCNKSFLMVWKSHLLFPNWCMDGICKCLCSAIPSVTPALNMSVEVSWASPDSISGER